MVYSTAKLGKIYDLNKASKNFNMPFNLDVKHTNLVNNGKVINPEDVSKIKQIIEKINNCSLY